MNFTNAAIKEALAEGFSSYTGIILHSHTDFFSLSDLSEDFDYISEVNVASEKEYLLGDNADLGICYASDENLATRATLFWDRLGKISIQSSISLMVAPDQENENLFLCDIVGRALSLAEDLKVGLGDLIVAYDTIIIPWSEVDQLSLIS